MEFDKAKVYTALNADELKLGSKVICAFTISDLKKRVEESERITEVHSIYPADLEHRICAYFDDGYFSYPLAYLISEPEEKKLKWTDLKIGDVIKQKDGAVSYLIMGMDANPLTDKHIFTKGVWVLDSELEGWEKVEK